MAYTADIVKISRELLGNVIIGSQEFLFNLDESPDFIYVDFTNSGYAVFAADSLEVLEFAAQGSLPYQNTRGRRYYNGPKGYYTKRNEQFVNEVTNESFVISASEARASSQAIRQTFSISKRELELEREENNGELIVRAAALSEKNKSPKEGTGFIKGTDVFYEISIDNSDYFKTDPTHGENEHGTCGSVAAQLLLSYNNYYNDRRIISPHYLNGGWHNATGNNNINDYDNYNFPFQDPNACGNPMYMTSQTTGSNNTFYNDLINAIEPDLNGSLNTDVIKGIKKILNVKNVSYSTNSYNINEANVRAQINAQRPVIIEMRKSLGADGNHYVVGYGYGDYKYPVGHPNAGLECSGYIVHYGWSSNRNNVWINTEWCRSYITMQINHTHTYVSTGTVLKGQEMILRCTTCYHRITDTLFTVSGNAVTGLKYPLTSAVSITIPELINDVPITVIGSSAFENQTNIIGVTIPNTVTRVRLSAFLNTGIWNTTAIGSVVYADKWAVGYKGTNASGVLTFRSINPPTGIGDYAFSSVTSLKDAEIPSSVTAIGTNAFSNNSSFERVWIPSSVTVIDSMVFSNCPLLTIYAQAVNMPSGWNASWNPSYRHIYWNSPAAYIRIISQTSILGIPATVPWTSPVSQIGYSDQYSGTVTWKHTVSGAPHTGVFAPTTSYTATINLTAKDGFTLQGVASNSFKVTGAATTNAANSGVITAVFMAIIDQDAIPGVAAPVPGERPVTQIGYSDQYTGTVTWKPNHTVFAAETQYIATIDLREKTGFSFHGMEANFFTVEGAVAATNPTNSGYVTAVFLPKLGFSYGDGTIYNPYLIKNIKHLQDISEYDSDTTYFRLEESIDLSDAWIFLIQFPLPHFYGHFDGNGKTISNLSGYQKNTDGGGFGLFEENSGTIENLHIIGHIGVPDETFTGMIAGFNYGVIRNCTARTSSKYSMIYATQTFDSCAGGIAGYNEGTIEMCVSYGGVQSGNTVGGIVGYNADGGTIIRSYNYGIVSGYDNVGGIVGYNARDGLVLQSYNSGQIYGYGENNGGIAGQNHWGVIENTYNTGNVSGGNYVGGIVGYNSYNSWLAYSYNIGSVSGGNYIGGIAGSDPNTVNRVNNCVSLGGGVSGTSNVARVSSGGGILSNNRARANMTVTTSGNSTQITSSDSNGIHGLDTSDNTPLSDVFSGWDTTYVWSTPYGNLSNGILPKLNDMPCGPQN